MFRAQQARCVRPAIRAMTIAVVRSRIADTRRKIVAATTSRPALTALMIAAVMASLPDRTVLTIVAAMVSLHGLMDRMVARASALIRVLGLVLLRWVETLDATAGVLQVGVVAAASRLLRVRVDLPLRTRVAADTAVDAN